MSYEYKSPFKEAAEAQQKPKKRECLKCGTVFQSTGPHNRLCHACSRKNHTLQRVKTSKMMMGSDKPTQE